MNKNLDYYTPATFIAKRGLTLYQVQKDGLKVWVQ